MVHQRFADEAGPAGDQHVAGQRPGNVLVTGGTGFIGETLVNQLLDAGHTVTLLARDPLRAAYLFQGRVRS
ncbi:NAD-dependent epimerase/dehydratase family protein, partial [Burkholderia cenocepacia]|uniref:NAD-dependent epimerase/dehydratase family protein n=1 Tax=Burkholderia cenocepacia TaxID=95486 RepID=UPI0024B75D23